MFIFIRNVCSKIAKHANPIDDDNLVIAIEYEILENGTLVNLHKSHKSILPFLNIETFNSNPGPSGAGLLREDSVVLTTAAGTSNYSNGDIAIVESNRPIPSKKQSTGILKEEKGESENEDITVGEAFEDWMKNNPFLFNFYE
ncbi:hypothetical protein FQA39_LY04986 [Lamprigera yunnana]|nr:hypothetical protein FQA39_LY04986 [Lamprigera yunnana]